MWGVKTVRWSDRCEFREFKRTIIDGYPSLHASAKAAEKELSVGAAYAFHSRYGVLLMPSLHYTGARTINRPLITMHD